MIAYGSSWKLSVGSVCSKVSLEPKTKAEGQLIDISVQMLSGEIVLDTQLSASSKVKDLRDLLNTPDQSEYNLVLVFEGSQLADTECLGMLDLTSGDAIHLVREEKPKPKPPPPPPRERSVSPNCSRCCSCFTGDSTATVLGSDDKEVLRSFADIREGDRVRTGARDLADRYRRVTRMWPCLVGEFVQTVTLSQGCRLTTGHPVLWRGKWRKPEDISGVCETFEEVVYTIELEGHVDTILVSGIVCVAMGLYCGEEFGWNVFTRKTTYCDRQPCAKCAVQVIEGLDFSSVDASMMEVRYEPH